MLKVYTIKQETILALRDAPPAHVLAGDLKKAANAEIYYGRDIANNLRHFREQAGDLSRMLEAPMESRR